MIDSLLLGLGLVAIIEGLVLALAPGRLREVLEMLESLGPDRRRLLGLGAVAIGVVLVWFARG
jgi:uncharacterized protein YjeT (DUF2065 family)